MAEFYLDYLDLDNESRRAVAGAVLVRESFGFGDGRGRAGALLDDLAKRVDRTPSEGALVGISNAARGDPAWPPLARFKALRLSVCPDISDIRLAETLDDRGSLTL